MTRAHRFVPALFMLTFASGACSSTSANTTNAEPCTPGESVSCNTESGCSGEKLCKTDGHGFGECICHDAGGGGSGGISSGGSGASGGIGGTAGSAGVSGASGTGGNGGVAGTSPMGGTGGSADASGGTAGSAGTGGCPAGLPGPVLIEVPAPSGGSYCVDATEVTNAEYAAFLAASPSTSGQPPECSWNTTYAPTGWPRTGRDDYPVAYVDWCDAYAYCAWAGKRLCGKIGGGASGYNDYADATLSEWYNACSAGGTKTYPYGSTFQGTTCVGSDYDGVSGFQSGSDIVRPAGSTTGCEGGYAGLFDLSGNVWEWEDSCNGMTGTQDLCLIRGGAFSSDLSGLACGFGTPVNRGYQDDPIGFRCCRG